MLAHYMAAHHQLQLVGLKAQQPDGIDAHPKPVLSKPQPKSQAAACLTS
jgi:hypothetical protein